MGIGVAEDRLTCVRWWEWVDLFSFHGLGHRRDGMGVEERFDDFEINTGNTRWGGGRYSHVHVPFFPVVFQSIEPQIRRIRGSPVPYTFSGDEAGCWGALEFKGVSGVRRAAGVPWHHGAGGVLVV
jgi:hypothetical protein